MIQITNKSECCGCNACGDICPKKAISFETDIEGFWYPVIDKDKCTNCEICQRTCPELHANDLKKNDFEKPNCYAAVHKNLEVRFDSTSGGLFSALAEKVYKDNGFVGGVIYNNDFSASHFISDDKKDLTRLRSSKYLQSNAIGFYNKIEELLRNGKKVLVCSTPCQMAALRRFLAEDYENLIIVDFVCRGVNSPKAFLKYIASIEQRVGSKVIYIKAKSKELGWRQLATKFIFENGKTIFETKDNNLFTRGYLTTNVFCRPSCYMCKFKGFPRIADISIADFWGIENVEKSLDNDLGTSMVLLNSKKGETFFEFIKPKIESKQVLFETILPGNPVLISPLGPPKVNREIFFKELESSSFDEIALKYFPFKKNDVNVIKQIIKSLYNCTKELKKTSRFHLKPLLQFIKYNFFTKAVRADWKSLNLLYTTPNSIIEIHKNSKILLNGPFYLGIKKFFKSKLESRLLVEDSAKLEVNGTFGFGYGCDIEIFKNAELILNGSKYLNASGSNIGMTVICADRIEIGFDVQIGRNVTIRDNNGGHYIGCQGYKNSRPIIIGDRVWLGEGCTIMPGVKIGEGAIVGAKSLVISNVPAHSIVSGNPAKVVDVDVLWKY